MMHPIRLTCLTLSAAVLASCGTGPRPKTANLPMPGGEAEVVGAALHRDARLREASPLRGAAPAARPQSGDTTKPVSANKMLIQVGGSGSNDRDFDIGNGALNGSVGFTVIDQLELGVRQQLGFTLRSNAGDTWNGATQGVADYYLINGKIAPYVGASAGWIYGNTLEEDVILGPEAGVKFFLQPDAFLDLRAQYLFLLDAKDDFDDAFETGSWFYGLNMGMTF